MLAFSGFASLLDSTSKFLILLSCEVLLLLLVLIWSRFYIDTSLESLDLVECHHPKRLYQV